MFQRIAATIMLLSVCTLCQARSISVPIYKTTKTGHGAYLGTVTLTDGLYGMLIQPHLHDLPPGEHGFHIHQNPNCADYGLDAGGHLDPAHTDKHLGPYNSYGHLGDLPVLMVNQHGIADTETLAPRLTVSDAIGHSLMIHEFGDNYSDTPKANGGGGARIACGVIEMEQSQ